MINRPALPAATHAFFVRRFLAATGLWLFAGVALLSAQTRYIERGVGAGDSPGTFITTQRLFSVTELQIDPGAPLRVETDTSGPGYLIGREASSLVRRRTSLADGVEMSVRALTGTSAATDVAIPAFTFTGQRPFARAYVLLDKERIDVNAADADASTARLRIHASFSVLGSSLRSENRIWNPIGTASLQVSGTIYRRSGDQRISDFSSAFGVEQTRSVEGPNTTAVVIFGEGHIGPSVTPDHPGVGVAGGSGTWNNLNNTGVGHIDLDVPNGGYVEFTVTCATNAEILSFGAPQPVGGAAMSHSDISATGRVWATAPEGGSAIGQLGTTLRHQNAGFDVADLPLNAPAFELPASTVDGLPLVYALISGPATLSGRTVTPGAVRGQVVLTGTQTGDDDFAPIVVTRSFRLLGAAQTIDFPALADRPADAPPFIPPATASSGLPVIFTVSSGPATTEDGRTITLTGGTGTVRLLATRPGDDTHEPALSVERSFTVTPATGGAAQTITFPALLDAEVGAGQLLSATASSGLPVAFTITAGSATLGGINNNILSATAPGLVTVRASQPGGLNDGTTYAAATPVERSFTATAVTTPELLEQTISQFDLPDEFTHTGSGTTIFWTIRPVASSGLPVTLSVVSGPADIDPISGAVRFTGPGAVVLSATQAGDATYAPITVQRTVLARNPADPVPQTIHASLPLNLVVGATTPLNATATSGLPVAYEITGTYPAGIATLNGHQLSATAAGFVTLRLTQAGGVNIALIPPTAASSPDSEQRYSISSAHTITFPVRVPTYAAADPVVRVIPVQPAAMRAPDLNGPWTLATPEAGLSLALVFAADGKYYHGEAGNDDPNGHDGMETGAYAWSTLDCALSAVPALDQNGEWGLSHPRGAMQFIVGGDTLIGREGDDYFTLKRIRSTSPLVGAWRLPVEGGEAVLVFLPDGGYLHLETGSADESGEPGLETGAYAWTPATGRLTTTTTLDLNGEWGLSHSAPDLALRVSGDRLTLRENGAVVATATRVGAPAKAQTITFLRPAPRAYGSAPFALSAIAGSRLPVSFEIVSGPASLGEDGRTLTLHGAGAVVIRASQAGDATFAPAIPVEQTLVVTRAAQRITFAQPAPTTAGDEPFGLAATSSSGLPVAFEIVSSRPANAAVYNSALGVLTPQGVGRVTLRATQAGDENYAPAPAVTRGLEIRPKAPVAPTTQAGDELFVGSRPVRSLAVDQPATGLRYFASGLPAGLVLSPTTGELSGVITARPGDYPIRVWTQVGTLRSEVRTSTITVRAFPVEFTGGYEIAFTTPDEARLPWGRLDLQVATNGIFTGRLQSASAAPRGVRGQLHPSADGTVARVGLATPQGTFSLTFAGDDAVFGELVLAEQVVALVDAFIPLRTAADGPVPWSGAYTLSLGAFHPLAAPENPYPSGPGYATGRVAPTGAFTIKGQLADGTLLTLALAAGRGETHNAHPVYLWFVRPYKTGENYLAGHTFLTRDESVSPPRYDIAGTADQQTVYWKKSPQTGPGPYAAGFGPIRTEIRLQAWSPPTPATNLAARLGAAATPAELVPTITLAGMDPEAPHEDDGLPARVLLGADDTFTLPADTPAANARSWTLKLDAATGRILGTFLVPGDPATAGRPRTVKFTGVLFQPGENTYSGAGEGYFLLPPTTSGAPTLSGGFYLSFPD